MLEGCTAILLRHNMLDMHQLCASEGDQAASHTVGSQMTRQMSATLLASMQHIGFAEPRQQVDLAARLCQLVAPYEHAAAASLSKQQHPSA